MSSKFGGIVRRNSKAIIIVTILSLPLMALFQNCGKTQNFAINDVSSVSNKSSVVNTNDLPLGETPVDQVSSGSPYSGDSSDSSNDDPPVSIGMPSPEEQEEQEIDDSLAACAALENNSESNNINGSGVFSADHKSASNINGKHVLSSANFNGNTQIDSISNSFGSLTICGLDVGTLSNYGGKVTLVGNSKITNIENLNGRLVVLDGSGAKVRSSKVVINKVR